MTLPLVCLIVSAVALLPTAARGPGPELFRFHYEGVLGTSLDMQERAPDAAKAALAETAALAQTERLRRILSSHDPQSEMSRFNASTGP